jgi:hypothetical protein
MPSVLSGGLLVAVLLALAAASQSDIRITPPRPDTSIRSVPSLPLPSAENQNPWVAACGGRSTSYGGIGQSYWLRGGGPTLREDQQIDPNRIVPVTSNRSHAKRLLAKRPFIRLTRAELKAFTGEPITSGSGHDLQPYLVRSVGAQDTTLVRWDGQNLEVIGIAMGECPSLINRPVIVFLERRPQQLFVVTYGAD